MPHVLARRHDADAPRVGLLHALLAYLVASRRSREERDAARAALREQLVRAVEREPGASPTRIVDALGIGWSTYYLHLARLKAEGRVQVVSHGRRTFLYPAGVVGDVDRSLHRSLLVGDRARALAAELVRAPGHDIASLARAVGISPRVVYHHVRRLTAAGLVHSSLTRGYRDLRASERLASLLREEGVP